MNNSEKNGQNEPNGQNCRNCLDEQNFRNGQNSKNAANAANVTNAAKAANVTNAANAANVTNAANASNGNNDRNGNDDRNKWQIAGISFDSPYFLAPLAGITDSPFRRICRRLGAGAVYSEMISAKGLMYNDKATEKLLGYCDEELPLIYQIFGSDPAAMSYAAEALSERANCMIDINMGCPVPKVVKNGDGSSLLRDLGKIESVVSAVVKSAKKPVTVKIRIGWDEHSINAVENARIIEACGAAAICVHGRTREQYYSGNANREVIRQVREAVKIPVIGNGDIFDVESARDMFGRTGCDMVMIARGALGNPWIFMSLKEGRTYVPTSDEKISLIKEHFNSEIEEKGEYAGVRVMRKHVGWYLKGMRGAASMRREINEMTSRDEIFEALDRILENQ